MFSQLLYWTLKYETDVARNQSMQSLSDLDNSNCASKYAAQSQQETEKSKLLSTKSYAPESNQDPAFKLIVSPIVLDKSPATSTPNSSPPPVNSKLPEGPF